MGNKTPPKKGLMTANQVKFSLAVGLLAVGLLLWTRLLLLTDVPRTATADPKRSEQVVNQSIGLGAGTGEQEPSGPLSSIEILQPNGDGLSTIDPSDNPER